MDLEKTEKEEKPLAAVVPVVGTGDKRLSLLSTNTIITKQTCWFFPFIAFTM